jgi:hypothetical protein
MGPVLGLVPADVFFQFGRAHHRGRNGLFIADAGRAVGRARRGRVHDSTSSQEKKRW